MPDRVVDGGNPTGAPKGAWAKPLRARKLHFFRDGFTLALCGAYSLRQVQPSDYVDQVANRCPTCVRKLGYFSEAPRG